MYHSITSLIKRKNADLSKDSIKYLNKLASKFGKAIDNRRGGVKLSDIGAMDDEREENEVENIRFSRMNTKSYSENVDDIIAMTDEEALRRKSEETYVAIMSETPSVILENAPNAENLEVIIRFDALYLATRESGALEGHYHNLGEQIKDLPRLIANPDAIIELDNGRLNLFAEMETKKGKNGIISIELNTVKGINSKYDKYNLVISAFSAKDSYIRNIITKHGKTVQYKKEDLSQVNRQLYEWLAIVNEKSSIDSIPEKSEKINTFDKKSGNERKFISKTVDSEGNNLSLEQAEYFANSKVRDKNGNLLVVYHGTENDFNVFKSNSGYDEYFFTDSIETSLWE